MLRAITFDLDMTLIDFVSYNLIVNDLKITEAERLRIT